MIINSPEDWYVIKVFSSRELFIQNFIKKHSKRLVNTIVFSKEFIHNYRGEKTKIIKPLFPGYIFVQNEIQHVTDIVKQNLKNELIYPLNAEGKILKVREDEMKLLFLSSDENGIFQMSECYQEGNNVKILKGPLKNINGKILWINKRKKKAQVEISLFHRKMAINLGLNFVSRKNTYV